MVSAMSNNALQSCLLSPWAWRMKGTDRLTACSVPSPPSASLTTQTSRDHAFSDSEPGNSESTPEAPSAATNRVGRSRVGINSMGSIAEPRTAISEFLITSLRKSRARATRRLCLAHISISDSSTRASRSSALSTSSPRSQSKNSRTSSCSSINTGSTGDRSVGPSRLVMLQWKG